MATETLETQKTTQSQRPSFFSSKRGRILRENLTAYLFLTPATLIVFTFGIFPIFYAAYVSLYRWRILQGEYRGLTNFVSAMGDAAYVFFSIIAVCLIIYGSIVGQRSLAKARQAGLPAWTIALALIPGSLLAYGAVQILLRFITFFVTEAAIDQGFATKLGSIPLGLLFIFLGMGISSYLSRWQHRRFADSPYAILPNFTTSSMTIILVIGSALAILNFMWGHLQGVQAEEPETYALSLLRIRLMWQGIILLGLAYGLWNWGFRQTSNRRLVFSIIGAAGLIGAGLYLVTIWPDVVMEGDEDFFKSLQVTVFFSLGTVPIQLALSMALAVLLFQDIRGKGLLRIIFFIPYIAPTVATSGIFQVLFSSREGSLANQGFNLLNRMVGQESVALEWLQEAQPAINQIGQALGLEAAGNWDFGPSLALVVVIMYSIWVYTGYDTVIFLAGLGNIPSVLYEAAEIDGAGRWAMFRNITLPLLSPTTFFLSVISIIGTWRAFNSLWVLRTPEAQGTIDTATIYFFNTFLRLTRFGYATSMAMVLFAIILLLTLIQQRIAMRRVFYG